MSAKPQTQFEMLGATIADAHKAFENGSLTARALVDAYLSRIDAYDQQGPSINAIVSLNYLATTQADDLDANFAATGEFTGPLHGIPIF